MKIDTDSHFLSLFSIPFSVHIFAKSILLPPQKKGGPFELCTSNIAYVPDSVQLLPNYKAILSNTYQSYAKSGNFHKPELLREEINDTVKSQTNSRILELMPEGDILKVLISFPVPCERCVCFWVYGICMLFQTNRFVG